MSDKAARVRFDQRGGPWCMLWVTGIDGHVCLLSDIPEPGEKVGKDFSVSGLKSLMQQVQNVKENKRAPEDYGLSPCLLLSVARSPTD